MPRASSERPPRPPNPFASKLVIDDATHRLLSLQVTLEQKLQVLQQSKPAINRYIFCRTVVIAVHNEQTIIDHGTGMLLRIGDDHLVVTAAHVIRNYPPESLQIISQEVASDVRVEPAHGDLFGGQVNADLDVGFLRLSSECVTRLIGKSFLTLNDFELYPNALSTDLAIVFGLPEQLHTQPQTNLHSFGSFTFLSNIPVDVDWTSPGSRPLELEIEYPQEVHDGFTHAQQTLPAPRGMSGGGLWRANFRENQLWIPERMRLIAILTTHDCNAQTIRGNRVESLFHLLALHFEAASKALEAAEPSAR